MYKRTTESSLEEHSGLFIIMWTEIHWMRFICILFYLRSVSTFVVTLTPRKALFPAGGRRQIRCSVSGCAHPATMYWGFLADKPLEAQITSNGTDSVATFVPVTPDHEGTLLCKATCGAERKQSQALVTVYSFPSAPVVRVHEHVVEGEGLSLTCTVAGLYPPQMVIVDWLQGNRVLQRDGPGLNPIQSTFRFTHRTPGSRSNPDPDPSSDPDPDPSADPDPSSDPDPDPDPSSDPSITLTCRALLLLDGLPAEERSRETSVRLYAPGIREISSAAAVSPGSSVTLVCLVDGFPAPTITWTFSSPQGAQVAVGHHQRLVLEDVSGRQAGVYQCLAHNLLGSQTAQVFLTIEAPPSNTVILVAPGMEVEEGQTLNISCQSELVGPSVMLLTRGNQELQSSENSSSVFFILETKLQHSGLYRCESSNQYGTELVTASITVKAAPRNASVLVRPSTEVQEGQNVTISCHSVGYPPPTVTLRKLLNGVERYSSDGLFLLVNVSVNDSGLFQVNVTNELGYQTLNFTINVLGRSVSPPTESVTLVVSLVCVAVACAFAAMLLSALRRSRKKGLYKLTKAPPPPASPRSP